MSNPAEHLRVLHVITDRDRRGAQVFATDLDAGVRTLGVTSEVVALAPGTHGDLLEVDVLGSARRSLRTFRALRQRSKQVDIVVAHGSATLLACAIALVGSGVPFVYRQISDPIHWAGTWSRRLRVAIMIRRAAGVVALSDGAASVVVRHYRLKRSKVDVLPNAVPGGAFVPPTSEERSVARSALGVLPDTPMILYVGALATEKGVDIAVHCVAAANEPMLFVVGDGPDRNRLEALADQLAPDRVRFLGSLTGITPALWAADLLVLPSRGGDSMPAVLIEAGLCAVPVVSTEVGSISDVVIDGLTGRVVEPGSQAAFDEAVASIVPFPDRIRRLGEAGRAHCLENFTIEATSQMWIEVLSRRAGRRRTSRRVVVRRRRE